MATKIVTKNSSTASAVPTASDLVQGELAVNVADKRLFTEDNGGSIVELGTNPSTIDINAGTIDGTAIGASSASTGAFTTLTATGLTVDTTTLAVDSTNNRVGIGTSSPAYDLDIEAGTAQARIHSTAGNSVLRLDSVDDGESKIFFADNSASAIGTIEYHHDSNYMSFDTVATERMRIDSSGHVGIGTSSPSTILDVKGAAARIRISDTDTAGTTGIEFVDSGGTKDAEIEVGNSTQYLAFKTATAERMRIDGSGQVGIGTTTVGQFESIAVGLTVDSGNVYSGIAMTDGATTSTLAQGYSTTYLYNQANGGILFGTNNTERMRIDSSGNLLVGGTSSNAIGIPSVEVGGSNGNGLITVRRNTTSAATQIYFKNPNGYVGQIQTNGSSTSYITTSDYRLKENVVELTGATERLKQLNPSRFNFIADADTTVDGFLAHEVADVVPEAVSGEKDAVDADGNPDYQGIDQSKLVPLLVATIQELEARITQLENN